MRIFNSNKRLGMTLVVVAGLIMAPLSAIFGAAAQDQVASPSNDEATPEKIRITAQRLISDISGNQAEFVGEVKASQGETEITADSLKIFFGDQSTSQNASPAQSLEKLIATGNVQIKFDNRLAVARQAVYITAQRVLILNGPGATVSSGENTITGETITFYRADGRFTVEGGSSGRVSAVILPEKSGLE